MTSLVQQRSISILDRCLNLQSADEGDISRQQRLDDLITEFAPIENTQMECALGWFFCVPASFRAALDVKQTIRVIGGKPTPTWTQGAWFHFKEGDTIYDSVKAYLPWNLNNFNICLDIRKGSPAQPASGNEPRRPGTVIFDVLKPDAERKRLINCRQTVLSQDDFVRFLILGTGLPELAG